MCELPLLFHCFTIFSQDDWLLFQDSRDSQKNSYSSFPSIFSPSSSHFSALTISHIFVCLFVHFFVSMWESSIPLTISVGSALLVVQVVLASEAQQRSEANGSLFVQFPKMPFTENYLLSMQY